MKIIITEDKRNRAVIIWLDENYGNCRRYILKGSFDRLFYINENGVIFVYQTKGMGTLFISDDIIKNIENIFGIDEMKVSPLLEKWFSKKYNLHPDKTITGADLTKFSELYNDEDYEQF